jgi:hypothetical protein
LATDRSSGGAGAGEHLPSNAIAKSDTTTAGGRGGITGPACAEVRLRVNGGRLATAKVSGSVWTRTDGGSLMQASPLPTGLSGIPRSWASGPENAQSDELELGADVDGALKAARDRAETGMEAMDTLDLLASAVGNPEPIPNGDAANHENLVLEHNLADRLDLVALRINLDLTRLQRAGERARQSAPSRRHDVIQRGRVRWVPIGGDAVVLGDL